MSGPAGAIIVVVCLCILGFAVGYGCAEKATSATPVCHYRAGRALPDPRCTPGMTNPAVPMTVDDTYSHAKVVRALALVCKPGWAASVRPPSSYTAKLKRDQMAAYGSVGPASAYQEDHLIPLELGGSPRDPRNLWPQPIGYARAKDKVEDRLHRLVCDGVISLWAARGLIATDWRHAG